MKLSDIEKLARRVVIYRRRNTMVIDGQFVEAPSIRHTLPCLAEYDDGVPSIYFLFAGSKLVYVGFSKNVVSRLRQHILVEHKEQFDRFYIYQGPKATFETEYQIIAKFKPPLNRNVDGERRSTPIMED